MCCRWLIIIMCLCIIPIPGIGISMAGDLDDGISKSTDDGISSYDNLGNPDKNIKYKIIKAKAQASAKSGQSDGGNMNSVVLGAGSNFKGNITIIDNSKGPKTQVVGK